MVDHTPRHDHLLRVRPAGELLRELSRQARQGRLAEHTMLSKSRGAQAAIAALDLRVADVQREFDAQKVGQRLYVVDANGFGTHLTIQEAANEAIAASAASAPTAVIYINPGTYVENITLDFSGSAMTALNFVAEGVHGSASDLVFPSEVAPGPTFVASVIIQPEDSTTETFTFTGDAAGEVFIGYQGIEIEGNLSVVDSGNFTAKIRLLDSMVDYTGSDAVFEDNHASAVADILLVRSLIDAPSANLFRSVQDYQLFGLSSRIVIDKIDLITHTGTANPANPMQGTTAAFNTCHLEIRTAGFAGEYAFLLLLSGTLVLPDNATGGVTFINGKVLGNLGLIGLVIIDDEQDRTNNLIELDGVAAAGAFPDFPTRGLITGVNCYGRGDIDESSDPAVFTPDATPEGTAIYIDDTVANVLNITNNRFIGYANGVECATVSSLGAGSIIGPNTFTLVTTPYTNISTPYLYQWPLMKARVVLPRPVAVINVNAAHLPFVGVAPTNISAIVGLTHIDSPIEITKVTYRHLGGGTAAATVRVALYSEDGQTRFFNVTDAVGAAAAGDRTVAVPQQVLPAGDYYIFFCQTVTAIPPILCYQTLSVGILAAPTGSEYEIEGALIIAGGAAPTTFSPTGDIGAADARTGLYRLDGVAS